MVATQVSWGSVLRVGVGPARLRSSKKWEPPLAPVPKLAISGGSGCGAVVSFDAGCQPASSALMAAGMQAKYWHPIISFPPLSIRWDRHRWFLAAQPGFAVQLAGGVAWRFE